MTKTKTTTLTTIFILFFNLPIILAQEGLLTKKEKREVIEKTSEILIDKYVFPEVGTKISEFIIINQKKGGYDSILEPDVFAQKLTEDVQSVSNDRHLRILFEPDRIKRQQTTITPEDSIQNRKDYLNWLKRTNYGFSEVKIMEGNIGYVNILRFSEPNLAGTTADAIMQFLKNTDAIIFDLRKNGGGTPQMVQWIISYFFEGEPFLLNSFYKREENIIKQFWTLPHPEDKRMPDIPLYVLTSKWTFSAAEEFAYDLKHLKRATIIGETTGGGAHPGGRIAASDKFNVWIPVARAINPVTNTNWEGKGVTPNIEVPSDDALKTAHIRALETLKEKNENAEYDEIIQSLKDN